MILKREDGFTLLELLLSIVLFGILLSFFFNFITDGFQRLDATASKSEIQSDTRFASYIIRKELANSIEVELMNTVSEESGYNYISYNNNSIKLKKVDGSVSIIGKGNINNILFKVVKVNDEETLYNYFLEYEIQSLKNNQDYGISSKILFNNLTDDGLKSSLDIEKEVIKYKNP